MKQLFIAILLCLALAAPASATNTDFAAQQIQQLPFNPTNIGADRTYTVSVTNGSATVLSASLFPADLVGRGMGLTVSISGTLYTVASFPSTGSLTLTTNYSGATGSATLVLYKYVYLRIYADQTFRPAGSSQIVQQGSPGSSFFYAEYAVSIRNVGSGNVAYIQPFTIPSTTDSDRPSGTYQFIFYGPTGNKLANYSCPSNKTQLRVPSSVNNFADLCTYNSGSTPPNPSLYYTQDQINTFLPSCTANQAIYFAATGRAQSCLIIGSGLSITSGTLNASPVTTPPTLQYLGSSLTQRSTINVGGTTIDPDGDSQGIKAADNSIDTRTELTTTGVPTRFYNFITDGNASPDSLTLTTGSISSGTASLVVNSATRWKVGQGIAIAGAGVAGATLVTTVNAISGSTFTLNNTASTTVASARVQHDNTAALQTMITRRLNVYIPHGDYSVHGQITLPAGIAEGYPLIVRGAGVGTAKLFFHGTGNMFVATAAESIQNMLFEHLTISATQSASPATTDVDNQYGYAFDLTEATVVNNLQLKNLIINGWGRGALACPNCQNAVIEKVNIREYKTSAISLVSPETVYVSAGESNVTAIRDVLIELGKYVADSDVSLTGVAWTSGSKTITVSGTPFTSTMVGRWVRITDAGQTGGDVIAMIKTFISSSSVTLSAANNSGGNIVGGTGTLYKSNINSIWLHRASQGNHSNITIQGNWSNAIAGHATSAVFVWNSNGVNFNNLWVEDTGGQAGPDIDLVGSNNIKFTGYHSNSDPGLFPASHGNFMDIATSKAISIDSSDLTSSSSPFEIDTSSTLFIDNSYLGLPSGRFNTRIGNVIYGDNVHFRINGSESVGNSTLLDATYGENSVTNPRFDATAGATSGWTLSIPSAVTATNTGNTRGDRYVVINRQADGATTTVSQVMTQTVNIPDGLPPGPWVLGYDWQMTDHGSPRSSSSVTDNGQVYLVVTVSGGSGSEGYPTGSQQGLRWQNYTGDATPTGQWFRSNLRLYLGTGTGRSFIITVFSSAGSYTPIMRLTNFRLHSGTHAAYSFDQPITRYQGGEIETPSTFTLKGVADGCAQFAGGAFTSTGIPCGAGAGSGIASIAAPVGGAQTGPAIALALSTAGTDAAIEASANTITFKFPTVGVLGVTRGLLNKTEYDMFNSKIAGTIATSQIAVGASANTIGGSSNLIAGAGTVSSFGASNSTVGYYQANSSNGSAAKSAVTLENNSSGQATFAVTSTGHAASGLFAPNQTFINADTGLTTMLFRLNDSGTTSFKFGISTTQVARLDETGLSIATFAPSTKLDIGTTGLAAGFAGVRFRNISNATSPDTGITSGYLGVDASGYVKVITTPGGIPDPGANGVMVRTALNTVTARTITGTANEITVADGNGVSANPTLSIAATFDISGKTSTKPMKSGTVAGIPGTCGVGEYYFATDASAGSNTYACTAVNTWTVQAVAGSAGALSALTAAVGGNSINNGDNAQVWNSQLTTSGKTFFSFAENAAGTAAGTPHNVTISTRATSTVNPLQVIVNSDTTPAGIRVNTSGQIVAVGTGGVNGAAIVGANTVANSVLDADLAAIGANSTDGILTRTGAGTVSARTITGTANQITVSNGNGVSGNPTLSLPQDYHTAATPQLAALGLGTTAPTAGLTLVGKTVVNGDSSLTVGAGSLAFTVNTNNTETETYYGLRLVGTINTPSPNNNKTIDVLSIDTTNTDVTGSTVRLLNLNYAGASKLVVDSGGNATFGGAISVTSCTGCGNFVATLVSSNYSVITTDTLVSMDATAGTRTVTYFTAAGNSGKAVETCKRDTSANAVTVTMTAAYTLTAPGSCVRGISDGTNWILQ